MLHVNPGLHWQRVFSALPVEFSRQLTQTVDPDPDAVPSTQAVQTVESDSLENVPGSHGAHNLCVIVPLYEKLREM